MKRNTAVEKDQIGISSPNVVGVVLPRRRRLIDIKNENTRKIQTIFNNDYTIQILIDSTLLF